MKTIADTISDITKLSSLEKGWDDEDADIIEQATIGNAISIISDICEENSKQPSVGPCSDGSIDLFWKLDDLRLLVNVTKENGATFYLKTQFSNLELKGYISTKKEKNKMYKITPLYWNGNKATTPFGTYTIPSEGGAFVFDSEKTSYTDCGCDEGKEKEAAEKHYIKLVKNLLVEL